VLTLQPDLLAKKIRENLILQKNKLEDYLKVLDKEDSDIIEKDPDKLLEHINLEKNIIEELFSFKKILEPLETMYNDSPYKKEESITNLKSSLDKLTGQITSKSKDNSIALENVLNKMKVDLKNINSKNKFNKTGYETTESRFLDITG